MVHKENEKKPSLTQQVKNLISEKLQSRSSEPKHEKLEKSESTNTTIDDGKDEEPKDKKGLKFGIRVLPPAVGDRLFGKSPSKMQADNENNTNIERKNETDNKDMHKEEEIIKESEIKIDMEPSKHLERQGIVTSSGIRRDSDGIPLEMPNHMMQAAMSARENRKSAGNLSGFDIRKSKGKAPKPPPESLNSSSATDDTVIDMDMTDHAKALVEEAIQSATNQIKSMNFTDQFMDVPMNENPEGHSKTSTPESSKKRLSSDTESQMAHESDFENNADSNRIELNSSDITVHQVSEEECDDGRRTHSLGDLSKTKGHNQGDSGTLERAQSLDITDSVTHVKKRKAPTDVDIIENKELGHGMMDSSDGMHGTLKSANQWGNLADCIFETNGNKRYSGDASDKEDSVHDVPISETTIDLVRDVMNVVDNIDSPSKESHDEEDMKDSYLKYHIEKPPRASKGDSGVIIRGMIEKKDVALLNDNYNNMVTINNMDPVQEIVKQSEQFMIQINNEMNDGGKVTVEETVQVDPVNNFRVETQTMFLTESNDSDQVKITGYDTNVPDDMKASRYPFNSLERPKSDVLKKLVSAVTDPNTDSVQITTTTTTTTIKPETIFIDNTYVDAQPVSLTLINTTSVTENEMTESSQNSPVYASDNHGVNSISISSMNILPDVVSKGTSEQINNNKNVVMISSSQPSSIIMIEDETLDFTLQAPDEEDDPELDTFKKLEDAVTKSTEEIFVIEMNGSQTKEESKEEYKQNGNESDSKNYVTEITVKSLKKDTNKSASSSPEMRKTIAKPPLSRGKSTEYVNGNGRKSSSASPSPNRETSPKSKLSKMSNNFHMQERRHTETNFIPRNNEIKFTQSTYESPLSKSYEKRSSHIEQIRSNFENKTDIPVAVRKSSIPTLKNGSPSKIPVSKSTQRSPSQDRNKQNGTTNGNSSNKGSPTNTATPLVSVTSIKNSSKHPSGK